MPRPSKRSKVARAKPRGANNWFARKSDATGAMESEATTQAETIEDNAAADAEAMEDNATTFEFLDDWWQLEPRNLHPTTAQDNHKRPLVYTGDSERTRQRKTAANARALVSCPMAPISTWFKPNIDTPSGQCMYTCFPVDQYSLVATFSAPRCIQVRAKTQRHPRQESVDEKCCPRSTFGPAQVF